MLATFYIILPLMLLVALGHVAARAGLLAQSDWLGIERFSFKIMIPALLVQAIARSDLSLSTSGPYVLTIILALLGAGLLTLALRVLPAATVDNPQLSSMFQASTRWNGLITLTIADQLYPENGLIMIGIAMAFLVPLINVANISVLSVLNASGFALLPILKNIAANPLILGCAVGLFLNLSGIALPWAIDQALDMTSRGALAVGLICIGAGFDLRRLILLNWKVIWTVGIKFIASPLIAYTLSLLFGLSPMQSLCAVLAVATPAATNGYIVARHMGGDAELYAIILNWQLVLSVPAFPVLIYLMQGGG
ncbi:MAG: hypothetical protein CSA68_09540 [Rhodobacterales bacterium]|nr:MAG: hypothetical protein CSA68_09540 [Rhodobacterales bacterium]